MTARVTPGTPLRLRQVGPRRICARASRARGVRLLSTGGTAKALRRRRARRHRRRQLHRLSGNARRPRQDAAPEGARRHPRAPRPARARGGARASTASRPSTSWWSTSIRSAQTVAKAGCTLEDAIENIDIGGPSMVRAAAKNWPHVGVVVDPADYPAVLAELVGNDGALADAHALSPVRKAFAHTARLRRRDRQLAHRAATRRAPRSGWPDSFHVSGEKVQDMRYGENPHQPAAFYRDETPAPGSIATYRQLQGKELSYNNIADSDAAWECVKTFARAGVRHRQARQSLRRRHRRHAARRLPQGVRHRSDVGLRRHHRVQPAGRRRHGRSRGRAVRGSADRARRTPTRRSRSSRRRSTCACSKCRCPPAPRRTTRST